MGGQKGKIEITDFLEIGRAHDIKLINSSDITEDIFYLGMVH